MVRDNETLISYTGTAIFLCLLLKACKCISNSVDSMTILDTYFVLFVAILSESVYERS